MSMLRTILFGLLAAAPLAGAAEVAEFTLKNGLKVLVKPDHRAPVVVSQVWYKVGSSDEHNGITGLSHMLEHMMFKGTDELGPGEFSRIIAENGGRENAATSFDYTWYFQTIAADRLPLVLRLEADRMRDLRLNEAEFVKERAVVAEERRMRIEDNPDGRLYELLHATAFVNNPYRHLPIGYASDIEHYTLDDLRDWYRRFYAPNNAVLVVAGDVEPAAVRRLAEKHFGPIAARPPVPRKPRREAPQSGPKRVVLRAPARTARVAVAFKAPSLTGAEAADAPALAVLAALWAGSDAGRLRRRLLRERPVASEVSVDYDPVARHDTLFTVAAEALQGVDAAELERAVLEAVAAALAEPVPPEALARIKTQLRAEDVYARDSVYYQAMLLGRFEIVGLGWRQWSAYRDALEAVDAETLRAAAARHLVEDRRTVAVLEPRAVDSGEVQR
ncbi:MAG: peptidase M16 [Gammaproteobacteria bacterium]|nr:MAG: peptidase M16 [Gammaproteobacteria bacterium]